MKPQVISGQRILCRFNGNIIAAGHVIDYMIETGVTEINCLDNVLPDELAPERVRVRLTLRVYRTPDNDPGTLEVAAGEATGETGEVTNENSEADFLKQKYFTVEVRDKATDKTILFVPRCLLVRRTGSASAQDLLTETWEVLGIGYRGPGD